MVMYCSIQIGAQNSWTKEDWQKKGLEETMGKEQQKDDEQLTASFPMRMTEEDKVLFTQFAKDQKMSLASFFRTAANAYMINRGHLTESPILGVLEKNLPFHIVRVPVGESDVFQRLISHLKGRGYKVWGKSFTDTTGCIMQLMVLNEVSEGKIKS